MSNLSRRTLLGLGAAAVAGAAVSVADRRAAAAETTASAAGAASKKDRWLIAINTSTIRPATLEEKIDAAAKAGYDGIELWSDDLDKYEKAGGSLDDLGKRIKDAGLSVPNIIGIWNAFPLEEAAKAKLIEDAKRRLTHAAKVGAKHIAAVTSPDRPDFDVLWAAGRYAELMELGRTFGVLPALEYHSFLKTIHTMGQVAAMLMESGCRDGSLVADSFHLYNGRGNWAAAKFLTGAAYAVWHINDAPPAPPAGQLKDAERVYPGDGCLPLVPLLKDLWAGGFRGPLSLEMFNREEWKKPAAEVAKIGIDKIRKVIAASGTEA